MDGFARSLKKRPQEGVSGALSIPLGCRFQLDASILSYRALDQQAPCEPLLKAHHWKGELPPAETKVSKLDSAAPRKLDTFSYGSKS